VTFLLFLLHLTFDEGISSFSFSTFLDIFLSAHTFLSATISLNSLTACLPLAAPLPEKRAVHFYTGMPQALKEMSRVLPIHFDIVLSS